MGHGEETIAEGRNGPTSYVLIYNPYHVIKGHFEKGSINVAIFNALKQRMIEIGAQDLDDVDADVASPETAKDAGAAEPLHRFCVGVSPPAQKKGGPNLGPTLGGLADWFFPGGLAPAPREQPASFSRTDPHIAREAT